MIERTFKITLTEDGFFEGITTGTEIIEREDMKLILAFLLGHAKKITQMIGLNHDEYERVLKIADKMLKTYTSNFN